jgi:hypothetical protein
MCGRSFRRELADLNIEASGSIREAELQRAVHQALFVAIRDARSSEAEIHAVNAWEAHMAEHREQAAAIRAGRQK